MGRLLVTGFDAFGSLDVNVSEEVVRALPRAWTADVVLRTEVLPTVYAEAGERIVALIRRLSPEAVVLLGVGRGRGEIQLERVALNLDDSETADNRGEWRVGETIDAAGPVGYWSTLPLEAMRARMMATGARVSISNHAGTFLCNHVFYAARHEIERSGRRVPCGFVHLPEIDIDDAGACERLVLALREGLLAVVGAVRGHGTAKPLPR